MSAADRNAEPLRTGRSSFDEGILDASGRPGVLVIGSFVAAARASPPDAVRGHWGLRHEIASLDAARI